jgi:hypothetical protein
MVNPYANNVATSTDDAAMAPPRAEFRVFGHGIVDLVQARMWEAHAVLRGVRKMPAEIYLLSTLSDDIIVKVRDDLLDIKVRAGTTPEGYEIYQPQGKFPFPLGREELARALLALKAPIDLVGDAFPVEALIAIAMRQVELTPVTVEKTRHGFTVEDVICEYAEVRFNGALMESACCECENHAAMVTVVGMLGLTGFENVNYVKAAKRIVGMQQAVPTS